METVAGLLRAGAGALAAFQEPRREAEILLGFALAAPRSSLYAHPEREVDERFAHDYRALVARRAAGVPVAYLTGLREFWSLALRVSPSTLVPRAETELLVAQALDRLPDGAGGAVADLGTGCGAVALALATERPELDVVATDVSARALEVARENIRRLGRGNVRLVRASWLDGFAAGAFDLIVSNPPYVAVHDPHLLRGDPAHEPRLALVAGSDGLDALRAISARATSHLRPGGWLLLEHGWDQGAAVRMLLARAGLEAVGTVADLAGHARVSGGRRGR